MCCNNHCGRNNGCGCGCNNNLSNLETLNNQNGSGRGCSCRSSCRKDWDWDWDWDRRWNWNWFWINDSDALAAIQPAVSGSIRAEPADAEAPTYVKASERTVAGSSAMDELFAKFFG